MTSLPGDRPLVSVGLPVYNASRYLDECLDSILAQSYGPFEVVLSDNASTDGTQAICERRAAADSRVRYQRVDRNRGLAWNHNRVRELARGAYFKWCGADDLMASRFLEACVDALSGRPDAVLAYPLSVVIDDAGQTIDRTADRLALDADDVGVRFATLLSSWRWTHNPFYGLMRASSLAEVRPISPYLANDRTFLAELAIRGPFVRVEEFLMYRRRNANHASHTDAAEVAYMAPERGGEFATREWTVLREHLRTVLRAPVRPAVRLRLLRVLSGWTLRERGALLGEARGYARHLARRLGARRSRP